MAKSVWKHLLGRLRPRTLLGLWSGAAFLVAVIRLLLATGARLGALVFLFPPLMALVFQRSHRKSTQVMAALFLTLIDVGVAIAPFAWLFPHLRPIIPGLSQTDSRILGWYLGVYLLYVFAILPPFVFGRDLLDRRRGIHEFSTFTNVLGLTTWALVGPAMCWLGATQFGLWPPVRW